LNFVFLGWLLGSERSKSALLMSAVGHGTNIGLDLLFIGRFGWGAAGAGAATAWSRLAMLLCALWLSRDLLRGVHWGRAFSDLRDLHAFKRLASLNTDILIRTVALVSVFGVFTNLAAMMGTVVLAAAALVRQVISFSAFFVDGFAFATESLAGYFAGASRQGELRRLLRMSILASVLTSALFAGAFLVAPHALFSLFTDHGDVLRLASRLRFWLIPTLLIGAIAYALDGYFLGISAGAILRKAMLWSAILGFAPFAWIAIERSDVHLLFLALSLFMCARVWTLGREIRRSTPSL
jgi:MATE family multidrug resistance protein